VKQVLHIFSKDVRHFWCEAAVSIALVIAFGWNEVRGWGHDSDMLVGIGGVFSSRFLSGLVVVLLPIAWSFLIVRAIQGESLVGDRQFWITRPYEWKKLLVSKVLFVLIFVNLPLLILDLFLLARAGFTPARYIVGLIWMQGLIILFFVLPVIALATVTATLAQLLLGVLVIVLYMVGMVELSQLIPSSSFSSSADSLSAILLISTSLAVVVLQYARRKTTSSRLLILGLGGAILLILVATPYRTIVAREYPQNIERQPPFQLGLLAPKTSAAPTAAVAEKDVEIRMPLSVSGIAPESIVLLDGVLVTIEASNGLHWDSGWRSPGIFLFPDQKSTQIDFTLKRDLFERLKLTPARVEISLAFTLFHDKDRRDFVTPHGKFPISGVGLCTAEMQFLQRIQCLAPLRGPSFLVITADMSASTCPLLEGETPASPGEIARGWIQNGGSEPAEFGISPVMEVDLYLSYWNRSSKQRGPGICPGTPIVLSNPELVLRNQTALHVDGVRLAEYRQQPLSFEFSGVSIRHR
jgi:hypothetical protein